MITLLITVFALLWLLMCVAHKEVLAITLLAGFVVCFVGAAAYAARWGWLLAGGTA